MADTPEDKWATLQREDQELKLALAGLSRQSKVVVDPVSGHDLHVDDPQLVVLAIGEVADAVQHADEQRKLDAALEFLRARNAQDYAISPNGIAEAKYLTVGGIEQQCS